MMGGIYLLLGTNLGEKRINLEKAKNKISELGRILRESAIYKSQAWGVTAQPDFYNQVIEMTTTLSAKELLAQLLAIEIEMGRTRYAKWGTRLIDIDILFFRDEVLNLSDLVIPHPEIANRRFTLLPLCELEPEGVHPVYKKRMSELLAACTDPLEVSQL